MRKKAEQLTEILGRIVPRLKPRHHRAQERLWKAWKLVVGEEKAEHTRVTGLRRGCLHVEVESSALLQELTAMDKADLKAAMQEKVEGLFLVDIKLKLAKD